MSENIHRDYYKEHFNSLVHLNKYFDNESKIPKVSFNQRTPFREIITQNAISKAEKGFRIFISPCMVDSKAPNHYIYDDKKTFLSIRKRIDLDLDWGGKIQYLDCNNDKEISNETQNHIIRTIVESMERGPITGAYIQNIRLFLLNFSKKNELQSSSKIKRLIKETFFDTIKAAGLRIAEPIYRLEITTPFSKAKELAIILRLKRAYLLGIKKSESNVTISANIPIIELKDFRSSLSQFTANQAMFSLKFLKYQKIPKCVQDRFIG